jgi:hypothetical protein
MSDAASQASTSATPDSYEKLTPSQEGHSDRIDVDLAAALPVEEQAVEHICFLAKHANTSTEVRLTVKDTVAELKAVSAE